MTAGVVMEPDARLRENVWYRLMLCAPQILSLYSWFSLSLLDVPCPGTYAMALPLKNPSLGHVR